MSNMLNLDGLIGLRCYGKRCEGSPVVGWKSVEFTYVGVLDRDGSVMWERLDDCTFLTADQSRSRYSSTDVDR